MNQYISLFLKGLAMGAANVIPGVSGGTIAFITNIYERLINALKSLDLGALRLVLKLDFKGLATKIDIYFLMAVGAGIVVSILSLAKVLEYAFTFHETLTMAFFFGLILASILSVGKQVEDWNFKTIIGFLIGAGIAISIGFLSPATANDGLIYVFLCGVVAICSMILPGLSGSYILLLMGNYVLVLQAIGDLNFRILLPLLLGCLVGLIVFSRILSYLFTNFRDVTVALLTGFVAGSLLIIWPWKTTEYAELGDKTKAIGYHWFLPELDFSFSMAMFLIIIGFVTVYLIDRSGKKAVTT